MPGRGLYPGTRLPYNRRMKCGINIGGTFGRMARFTGRMDHTAIMLVFLIQIIFFPYFPKMNSANELSRLYLTEAMVEDRSFEITGFIKEYGNINDKSVMRDERVENGRRVKSERFYSDKPPGTAIMALPGVALRHVIAGFTCLRGDMRLARLFVGILPTLLLLGFLRREMEELGVSPPIRAVAILGYGLGTLAMPYSMTLYGHQPVAVMLYVIWFLLRNKPDAATAIHPETFFDRHPGARAGSPTMWAAAAVGFVAAFCLMTEYQAAVYLVPLAILFLVRVRPLWKGLAVALAGAAMPLAFLAFYHHESFGGILQTGYNHIANPFFAAVHQKGFMGVLYPGWKQFAGSFFLPSKGLFVFSPFLILGFVGLVSHFRVAGRQAGWFRVVQVALPALFVSSMVYWDGGWTVGQRHLTPMIPFLIAPAALLMQRVQPAKNIGIGLVAASIMFTGLATLVYPHLPENIPNPFHDLTVPLFAGGCLSQAVVGFDLPSYWVLAALGAAVAIMLVVAAVAANRCLPCRAAALLLLILMPVFWYGWTSQVARLDENTAVQKREYFEKQCQAAGRWDELPSGGKSTGGSCGG